MGRPLALATCAEYPRLSRYDAPLMPALARASLAAEPAVWDDPSVDWSAFSGVLIRSCWDYHLKLPAFERWLAELERRRVPVWNPLPTLRWNLKKDYLRACPAAVPTEWLAPGRPHDLDALMRARGWDEAVVKPLVSASAHKTVRVRRGEPASRAAAEAAADPHGAMLQPFLPEIVDEGEWSLVFIDGAFCHAVLKRPAGGDFRVQEEHGGRSMLATPDAALLASAVGALACVPSPWLYVRVDGVRRGSSLLVVELELVEPSLYLDRCPATADRLADALKSRRQGVP